MQSITKDLDCFHSLMFGYEWSSMSFTVSLSTPLLLKIPIQFGNKCAMKEIIIQRVYKDTKYSHRTDLLLEQRSIIIYVTSLCLILVKHLLVPWWQMFVGLLFKVCKSTGLDGPVNVQKWCNYRSTATAKIFPRV